MIDQSLTDLFLTGVITYGAPALGLALLLGALGLPLPGTLLVIAVGAFVRQGVIGGFAAAGFGLAGAVLGDSLSYAIGYFGSGWVQRRFGQALVWQKAQATFERRGGWAVYLTRFLFTPLAIPVNLIAGGSGYAFRHFWVYASAGELTWIILYGSLGYLFGSQWELISDFVSDFSGVLVGIVALATGVYLLIRQRRARLALSQAVAKRQEVA
jgi:membrane protein DedA with SNARE-associated domain